MERSRWTLRRVTSTGRYLPSVDGLRFVAILAVVLFHLQGWLVTEASRPIPRPHSGSIFSYIFVQGHYGVQLFFVISGFILALPYAEARSGERAPASVGTFYLRRLTRLEPPYVLTLVLLFLLIPLASRGGNAPGYAKLLPHLLANLTYTHGLVYRNIEGITPVAWSLEVELQFYLLVPLIMVVFRARPRVARAALILGALAFMAINPLLHGNLEWLRLTLLGHGHYFLVGILASEIYTDLRPSPMRRWDAGAVLAIVSGILLLRNPEAEPLLAIPLGLLLYASLASRYLRQALSIQWISIIGGMCYSIYLWHFAVISALCRFSQRIVGPTYETTFLIQCAIVLPSIVLVCGTFYVLVERPCMNRQWPAELWGWLRGSSSLRESVEGPP